MADKISHKQKVVKIMYEDFSDLDHQDAYSTLIKGLSSLLEEGQGIFVKNNFGDDKVIIHEDEQIKVFEYNYDDFGPFLEGAIINFT